MGDTPGYTRAGHLGYTHVGEDLPRSTPIGMSHPERHLAANHVSSVHWDVPEEAQLWAQHAHLVLAALICHIRPEC